MFENNVKHFRRVHEIEAFKSSLLTGRPPAHEIYLNSVLSFNEIRECFCKAIARTQNVTPFQFMICNKLKNDHPLSLPKELVDYILELNRKTPPLPFEVYNEKFVDTFYYQVIQNKKGELFPGSFRDSICGVNRYLSSFIGTKMPLTPLGMRNVINRWLNPIRSLEWEEDNNRLAFEIITNLRFSFKKNRLEMMLTLFETAISNDGEAQTLCQWILKRKEIEYPYLISSLSNLDLVVN
jgi:hypothetical protein